MPDDPPRLHDRSGDEAPAQPAVARWRQGLWAACATVAVAPLGAMVGLVVVLIAENWIRGTRLNDHEILITAGLPGLFAVAAAFVFVRAGLRRDWPAYNGQLWGWGFGAAGMATLLVFGAVGARMARQSSKYKAMIPRQLAAAADQYYLENGYVKALIPYADLVGPDRYIKAYRPVDGEDPSEQFPILNGWGQVFDVRLPDGTTVKRQEVFASVGKSGLVATYPRPQENTGGSYDPRRVYQLSNGITFQDNQLVNRAPDPEGREGRDQDGVHIYPLGGAGRYEITYRGGVADGPFRAYREDGSLWVEATYQRGRVVGPAWHYLPDGTKFDELTVPAEEAYRLTHPPPPPAPKLTAPQQTSRSAANSGAPSATGPPPTPPAPTSSPRATKPPRAKATTPNPAIVTGFEKYQRKDFKGALEDFNRAIETEPAEPGPRQARANTRRMLGDLTGALEDYTAAIERATSPAMISGLRYDRAHVRRLGRDLAGSAADFRLGTHHPNARLWLFIVECERGAREDAVRELTAALEPAAGQGVPTLRGMPADVANLLLGRTSPADFEAKATTRPRDAGQEMRFLGHVFRAMLSRINGDASAATAGFRQALQILPTSDARYAFEIAAAREGVSEGEPPAAPVAPERTTP